jgi:tRNA A37 threonylcarbamoyladenosine dehydratase
MADKVQHRFSRTELLIGSEGLEKLSNARVAVIGLGGVGAYTVEALARAGVGWLILVDFDEICLTNTNRQIHALEGTYGRPKVEVMAERVKAINPEAIVVSWKEFLDAGNMEVILHGRVSYVVDAIDTVWSKVDLITFCKENGIPVISSMGTGNKLDPLAFKIDDISKTHTCPLAKSVRKALREKGIESGVKVVYSTELPVESKAGVATCHGGCICPHRDDEDQAWNCTKRRKIPGSMPYLPPIAGLIIAGEVIKDLLKENIS